MQNYKDKKGGVHSLPSEAFENLLPDVLKPFIKITQAQANALNTRTPETPSQADARKEEQINIEFSPALVAIVNIMDGANADTIIAAAKALRKTEL